MSQRKVDRRKKYIMVLDTETANIIEQKGGGIDFTKGLVYDCGFCITDKSGRIYESVSFINKDIFYNRPDLMQSCYFASKIADYQIEIEKKQHFVVDTLTLRSQMYKAMALYNIDTIAAYNAQFDIKVLNNTLAYATNNQYKYWFGKNIEVWDIMKMVDVITCRKSYQTFCQKNGFLTKTGRPRKSAEIVYRYILRQPDFIENHTGLEDVKIETSIMAYCFKQKKHMNKILYPKRS